MRTGEGEEVGGSLRSINSLRAVALAKAGGDDGIRTQGFRFKGVTLLCTIQVRRTCRQSARGDTSPLPPQPVLVPQLPHAQPERLDAKGQDDQVETDLEPADRALRPSPARSRATNRHTSSASATSPPTTYSGFTPAPSAGRTHQPGGQPAQGEDASDGHEIHGQMVGMCRFSGGSRTGPRRSRNPQARSAAPVAPRSVFSTPGDGSGLE
jgi:hypothetical protein